MDRQLRTARSTENCLLVPFAFWPDFDLVTGQRDVAIFARIVDAATLHLDRDDVGWSAIMFAASLGIEIDAVHFRKIQSHRQNGKMQGINQSSEVLRRSRRFAARDLQSGSPVSSGARGQKHRVTASYCGSRGGHRA